jgi:hypothetical protein
MLKDPLMRGNQKLIKGKLMSVQTSYELDIAKGLPGLIYALAPADVVTRAVETAAGVPFGVAVSQGTGDNQAVLGGTSFLGVSIRSLEQEGAANTGAIQWDEQEAMGILRTGYIYVTCPAGCVPGDLVKYTDATGVLDAGAAAAGETQLTNAAWQTTAAAGELGVIKIETSATTAGA